MIFSLFGYEADRTVYYWYSSFEELMSHIACRQVSTETKELMKYKRTCRICSSFLVLGAWFKGTQD
jgi:hypothetical protein